MAIGTFLFTTYVKKSNIRSDLSWAYCLLYSFNFQKIANKNGLKILDYKFNEINGGSIEIFVQGSTAIEKLKKKN